MDTELNRVPALDAQKKIWTSMTPQGRLGRVDELNGLAVYLGSDASSFVTGANFLIDVSSMLVHYLFDDVAMLTCILGRLFGLLGILFTL